MRIMLRRFTAEAPGKERHFRGNERVKMSIKILRELVYYRNTDAFKTIHIGECF